MGRREGDTISQLDLPPGFRFYPTDEELLVHYLCKKIGGHQFSLKIIGEVDLYQFDPWVLPSKAVFGENEWYFFSPRERKYPNGSRPNRVACSGYWKATGNDKLVSVDGQKVGIKKSLVFYVGKAPKGIKTSWIMHEYRIAEAATKKGSIWLDDWVLCRIYRKKSSNENPIICASKEDSKASSSSLASFSGDTPSKLDDFYLSRAKSLLAMQEEELSTYKDLGHQNINLTSQTGNIAWGWAESKSNSQTLAPLVQSHNVESQSTTFSGSSHPCYAAASGSCFCDYYRQ